MSKILFVTAAVTIPLVWGLLVEVVFERFRSHQDEKSQGKRGQPEGGERADDWVI